MHNKHKTTHKLLKAKSSNTLECTSPAALGVGCAQSRHTIIFLEFIENINVLYSTRAPGNPNKRQKKKKNLSELSNNATSSRDKIR